MENLIYIVMLIIYLIFAGLKKLAEEKAIEKNKGKTVVPSGEPDVFKRLEKLKELKENMEKVHSEAAPEPDVPEIPVFESVEPDISVEPPADIPVPVADEPLPRLEIVFDEDSPAMTNEEKKDSWGGGDTELAYKEEKVREGFLKPSEFNLQQAFIWKEILDKPLALR